MDDTDANAENYDDNNHETNDDGNNPLIPEEDQFSQGTPVEGDASITSEEKFTLDNLINLPGVENYNKDDEPLRDDNSDAPNDEDEEQSQENAQIIIEDDENEESDSESSEPTLRRS